MRPGRARCADGRCAHSGQSSVEYLVICAAVATALGIGMVGDNSVLRQLIEALRTAYENFAYAVSLP